MYDLHCRLCLYQAWLCSFCLAVLGRAMALSLRDRLLQGAATSRGPLLSALDQCSEELLAGLDKAGLLTRGRLAVIAQQDEDFRWATFVDVCGESGEGWSEFSDLLSASVAASRGDRERLARRTPEERALLAIRAEQAKALTSPVPDQGPVPAPPAAVAWPGAKRPRVGAEGAVAPAVEEDAARKKLLLQVGSRGW